MGIIKDVVGQRFGKLVALDGYYRQGRVSYQKVKCDCGTIKYVRKGSLIHGDVQSCGCLVQEKLEERLSKIRLDLTGQRFGRLLVLENGGHKIRSNGESVIIWKCLCECGNVTFVPTGALRSGGTQSCGCGQLKNKIQKSHIRGLSHSHLYMIWGNMKRRCYDIKNKAYKHYGGRGIKVCDEWLNKKNGFLNFYNWAIENGYTEEKLPNGKNKLTIDRINVSGNYEPSNCRWATYKQQANNKCNTSYITHNGETHTLVEWAEKLNVNPERLRSRQYKGYDSSAILYEGDMHEYKEKYRPDILEKFRKNMSIVVKNSEKTKKMALDKSKAVICIETQKKYISITEASKSTQISYAQISGCCNGRFYIAGGYHWAFGNDIDMQNKLNDFVGKGRGKVVKVRPIVCIETKEFFDTIADAIKVYGWGVKTCYKDQTKTCKGLHFRLATKEEIEEHNKK